MIGAQVEPGMEVIVASGEAAVRFRTAKGEDELAGLLSSLAAAKLGVTQFREVQTDLEEAFMTLAQAGDDAPAIESEHATRSSQPVTSAR